MSDQLTELDVFALLSLAHESSRSIHGLIDAETGDWAKELRVTLTDAERSLQPTGQA